MSGEDQSRTRSEKRIIDHSLGIDLGTTFSCAAYVNQKGDVEVIDDQTGNRTTPSVVFYKPDAPGHSVGHNTIAAGASRPDNLVYEMKRCLGRSYDDIIRSGLNKHWPFKVVKDPKAAPGTEDDIVIMLTSNNKVKYIKPFQVSADILRYIYNGCTQKTKCIPAELVVVTVPAYFSTRARNQTLDAAAIAFSNATDNDGKKYDVEVQLCKEPTAAALTFINKQMDAGTFVFGSGDADQDSTIIVFDVGGGTFDVSMVEISRDDDTKKPIANVLSVDGHDLLGGSDFDNAVVKIAKEEYKKQYPDAPMEEILTPEEMRKADIRLKKEAIRVKETVSGSMQTDFYVACLVGNRNLHFNFTSQKLNISGQVLFEKMIEKTKGVLLSAAGVSPVYDDREYLDEKETMRNNSTGKSLKQLMAGVVSSIDYVLYVGGTTRISEVKKRINDFLLGNTTDLTVRKKLQDALRYADNISPDTAIAEGAAIRAAGLCKTGNPAQNSMNSVMLLEKVEVNFNITTEGSVATKLIGAGTPVPCVMKDTFTTAVDNQPAIDIEITQGNSVLARKNRPVGQFRLDGLENKPRGAHKIEISFQIDKNFILTVLARDLNSTNEKKFVQDLSSGITKEELEKLKQEAVENDEADRIEFEMIKAKNEFENFLYQTKFTVNNSSAPEDKKKPFVTKIEENLKWLETVQSTCNGDFKGATVQIKEKLEEFKKLAEELAGVSAGGQTDSNNGGPDVQEVL